MIIYKEVLVCSNVFLGNTKTSFYKKKDLL